MNDSAIITTKTPERSHKQRLDALRRANSVRSERAKIKERLRNGDVSICAVIESPPECVQTAKVIDLILATPKMGKVKANRVLERCRISSSKTVSGLTPRQHKELLEILSAT